MPTRRHRETRVNAGIHEQHYGFHRSLSERFPYAIYYLVSGELVDIVAILEWVSYPKHRMVLLMCYAAGLRLSEATHVRLGDIDGARGMLHIRSGKGRKERYVPLAPCLLKELREYWKLDQPTNYLFAGRTANVSLSTATVQKACKMAAAQARINKPHVSPHTLRHSYATAMLEAGVDILTISRLLGHSSFVTTMVYLHCRRLHLDRAPSPIDWLPVRQCPKWIDPCDSNPFHPCREHPSVDPTQLDPSVPPAAPHRPAADRRQPAPESSTFCETTCLTS